MPTIPATVISSPTTLEINAQTRNTIINYIKFRLGDGMVDTELDPFHYNQAITQAMIKYRQLASHAVEEGYVFLDLLAETQEYILPTQVEEVRQVFRRGIGSVTGNSATSFEPFSSGFLNTYMLAAGRVGGLVNYELFAQYQKQAMTMFGGYVTFTFNNATKVLMINRKVPVDDEQVVLWAYLSKSDQTLFNDRRIFPWLQDYAYGMAKYSLGEAREKFSSIAGPQGGGNSLNGTALKAEAQAWMDGLIDEIRHYVDGSLPATFVIG